MIALVLGGQSSGKSDHALAMLASAPAPRTLLVTGRAEDPDFARRIKAHKQDRDAALPVIEARENLSEELTRLGAAKNSVLVDSLDFWLFSCIMSDTLQAQADALCEALGGFAGPGASVVLVSQEAGLCPVAGDKATRAFVRELGAMNRRLAALADEAWLVAAGLPLKLKG